MATLRALQANIDAGQTVVDPDGDGYVAAYKIFHPDGNGPYVAVQNFSKHLFNTFEELVNYHEPDEDGFTDKELDHWDIDPAPTAEELAHWQPFVDAVNTGDAALAASILEADLVKALAVAASKHHRIAKFMPRPTL